MAQEERESIVPAFGDWTLNDVKDSTMRALAEFIKGCTNGERFYKTAVILVILGLLVLGYRVAESTVEGEFKMKILLAIIFALFTLGLTALLKERVNHGTAEQSGRDHTGQPGPVSDH